MNPINAINPPFIINGILFPKAEHTSISFPAGNKFSSHDITSNGYNLLNNCAFTFSYTDPLCSKF